VHVENLVKAECSAISNAFLVGDQRKYLTMLISLKTVMDSETGPKDELEVESLQFMETLNLKYTKWSEILEAGPDKKVVEAIQEAINRANLWYVVFFFLNRTHLFLLNYSTAQFQMHKRFRNLLSCRMILVLQRVNSDRQ
jgi:hypothetical protein